MGTTTTQNNSLENRVRNFMEDYMPFDPKGDLSAICRNLIRIYGFNPTDDQIRNEVEMFYNC